MALDFKFDIRLAVENALYEHLNDMGPKEVEEVRQIINKTIDSFIAENNLSCVETEAEL